jgi:hypothetical protein
VRTGLVLLFTAVSVMAAVRADSTFHAAYRGAAADFSTIAVSENSAPQIILPVADLAVRAQIRDQFQPGDRLTITFAGNTVQQAVPQVVQVTLTDRLLVLAGCLAIHFIFGIVLLGKKLKWLVIGLDNRYSNSKCQMALWFGMLAVSYLSSVFLRWVVSGYSADFAGGIEIPKNLLLLSGLSVFSFGAAKGITATKQAVATAAANTPAPAPTIVAARAAGGEGVAVVPPPPEPAGPPVPALKTTACQPSFPSDLLCDDQGNPDIGDYQMMAVTAIAVAVYVTQILGFLGSIQLLHRVTIPDVDSTILATFGLGQGAYLVKKQFGD